MRVERSGLTWPDCYLYRAFIACSISTHKAIPSGNPVSGPCPHQFFAMPEVGHYWYYTCAILFKVHLKAQGSGFKVGSTYLCKQFVYL